jgi:hypothetical protein
MGTKCVFCGANAGKQNTPLQQHRPRCRWIGPANTYFMSHPDYYKMIAEDDQNYLPMMHASHELPKTQRELAVAMDRIATLEAKLGR